MDIARYKKGQSFWGCSWEMVELSLSRGTAQQDIHSFDLIIKRQECADRI